MSSHQKGNAGADNGTRVLKIKWSSRRTGSMIAAGAFAFAATFTGVQAAQAAVPTKADLCGTANDTFTLLADATVIYRVSINRGAYETYPLADTYPTGGASTVLVAEYPAGTIDFDQPATRVTTLSYTNETCGSTSTSTTSSATSTTGTSTATATTSTSSGTSTATTSSTTATSTGTATSTETADAKVHKSYVCKYVGTPGVDERLQTGQNPIWVDNHALTGKDNSIVKVGDTFTDKHVKSVVIVANTAKLSPEPGVNQCPKPQGPPSTTTTSTGTPSTTTSSNTTTTAGTQPTTSGGNSPSPSTSRVDLGNAGTGIGPNTVLVSQPGSMPWIAFSVVFGAVALFFVGRGLKSGAKTNG